MFAKNASSVFKKYALGIIILGCIAMYFSCCLTTDALNIIEPAFEAKFGWSYSSITLPFTIGGYILIGLSFVYSTFLIKKGTHAFAVIAFSVMAIGALLIGIAYSSPSNSFILFFVGALITKLSVVAAQMVAFQLCANWFDKTRGRALGIITMAAPLNSATSVTLMTLGQNAFGLTAVFVIIAVIIGIGVLLAIIFGTTYPKQKGLTMDGVEEVAEAKEMIEEEKPSMTMKDILTKPETWLVIVAFGFLNGIIGAVMAFFIARMGQVGVDTSVALSVLAAASLLGIPVSYIYGWLDDKIGTMKITRFHAIMYVIMLVCLYFGSASRFWMIAVAAVGMASMTGGTPHFHPATIMHVFGRKEYQNANRYIGIGISLVSSFGVQLMAMVMDKTGSLDMGYVIFGVLAAIATICLFLIRRSYAEE